MKLLELDLTDGKNKVHTFHTPNFDKIRSIELNGNLTLAKICLMLVCHFRYILKMAIDIEPGCKIIGMFSANKSAEHVLLFAREG
jgi:hypothetical protein